MYKCDKCGKNSEPKEKCNIIPVKYRPKHYKEGTTGQEIVKEQKLCSECMKYVNIKVIPNSQLDILKRDDMILWEE